jgi:hypothetical protein
MEPKKHLIPSTAVTGIASGLLMMAFFTILWSCIAYHGLEKTNYWYILLAFPICTVLFIIDAIKLFKAAKFYPKLTSEADIAEEKKMKKWFGIIFGAEGLGILIGINIVTNIGHADLVIPVIALVVGLHFYPLTKVFKRTIDYYLATWTTLVAVAAIVLVLNKTLTGDAIFAFTGVGVAIATSCYGIYMKINGRLIPKPEIL